jgi:hypothetical protein
MWVYFAEFFRQHFPRERAGAFCHNTGYVLDVRSFLHFDTFTTACHLANVAINLVLGMNKIPVTFTYQGTEYKGTLDEVAGAGANTWHLMVNGYYWGRLRRAGDSWIFDDNKHQVGVLVDHFAATLIAWYQ